MSLLRSLYSVFVVHRAGGLRLLVVGVGIMSTAILAVALIRRFSYGSYGLGADVFTGFLLGLTLVAIFNALVYFGAFGHPQSKERGA